MSKEIPLVLVHGLIGTQDDPAIRAILPLAWAPALAGYGTAADAAPDELALPAQVERLAELIVERFGDTPVHLLGHSIGGVVAMLLAVAYPQRVASIVNVEGNFTLKDAFWSARIAQQPAAEFAAQFAADVADPAGWLAHCGVAVNLESEARAAHWLRQQSAATVQALAASVVAETGKPEYLQAVRQVFARHPVHLVAGSRSKAGWDVPDWARQMVASDNVMAGCGHLMNLEKPTAYATLIKHLLYGNPA